LPVGVVARAGGQAGISVGEGLVKGESSGLEIGTNVASGLLGEGIGGLLGRVSGDFRSAASSMIGRLREGPSRLLSGRSASDLIGEIQRAVFKRDAVESSIAGAAAGAASIIVDERDGNR